jgi:hypothetical protein
MNRTFHIIHYPTVNQTYGTFIGKTPKQAALKAFHHLLRSLQLKNEITNDRRQFLVFSLIDKDSRQMYQFAGTRLHLVQPKNVVVGNKNITVHYKTIITSAKHVVPQHIIEQNMVG